MLESSWINIDTDTLMSEIRKLIHARNIITILNTLTALLHSKAKERHKNGSIGVISLGPVDAPPVQ